MLCDVACGGVKALWPQGLSARPILYSVIVRPPDCKGDPVTRVVEDVKATVYC